MYVPIYPQEHKDDKVMVFFITCAAVDYFSKVFLEHPAFKKLGLRYVKIVGRWLLLGFISASQALDMSSLDLTVLST